MVPKPPLIARADNLKAARLRLRESRRTMDEATKPWRHPVEKESYLWATIRYMVAAIELMADALDTEGNEADGSE